MKEQIVNFNGYSIINLKMSKNGECSKKKLGELNIETEHYKNSEDNKTYKLVMKLNTITNREIIDLEVEGYFEFNGEFEPDEIDMFLKVNAASILYPYCRAIVSYLTGLDSSQNVLLPILNFANMDTR